MHSTQSLRRNAQQMAHVPATVFGERTWTWAESLQRVRQAAAGLKQVGVGPGERVGILSLNSDRYHELLLAVWWLGAVVNPVNIRWSPLEIAYSLEDCGTSLLVVDDAMLPLVGQIQQAAPCLQTLVHCGEGPTPSGMVGYDALFEHGVVEEQGRGGDELAGIFYTGGTTGIPKGVMLTHANLTIAGLGVTACDVITRQGRLLHAAPMFHLAALGAWTSRNLMGGTHIIVPGFTPDGVLAAVSQHAVNDLVLVPTMLQMLVDSPAAEGADLSTLRNVIYGGSPIPQAVQDRVQRRIPNASLTQVYGMTETAAIATVLNARDHDHPQRRRSAGKAAPHCDLKIVNWQGTEVPRGTVGEIALRGGHIMQGYWNKPHESAAALVDGWLRTGDGARMDEDGYVFIADRIKDMIVTGGENVYSAEVENAIATHPAVLACAVIGLPDKEWGERVHAVVVPRTEAALDLEALRAHCRNLIAGYKCPRSMELIDALPTSGAGKILKNTLRQRHI
jgi:acyl-CoA synthetase (AMP-forming)/AMP-acid ligase II